MLRKIFTKLCLFGFLFSTCCCTVNGVFDGRYCKVVLIGEPASGKTCLLKRIAGLNVDPSVYSKTVDPQHFDSLYRELRSTGEGSLVSVRVPVCDTPGLLNSDRFHNMLEMYVRDADVVIITFDLSKCANKPGSTRVDDTTLTGALASMYRLIGRIKHIPRNNAHYDRRIALAFTKCDKVDQFSLNMSRNCVAGYLRSLTQDEHFDVLFTHSFDSSLERPEASSECRVMFSSNLDGQSLPTAAFPNGFWTYFDQVMENRVRYLPNGAEELTAAEDHLRCRMCAKCGNRITFDGKHGVPGSNGVYYCGMGCKEKAEKHKCLLM